MDMLEILKYLSIGVIGIIVCLIGLAIIGNILRLILDIVVFVIIAPFYILFHPRLFITKPMTCFKNIFMKTPCFGEDYAYSKIKAESNSPVFSAFQKRLDKFEEEDRYFRETYGTDMCGHKIK